MTRPLIAFVSAVLAVVALAPSTLTAGESDDGQRQLPLFLPENLPRPRPQQFARLNFDDVVTGEWASGVDGNGMRLLRWRRPIDVDAQGGANLTFLSSVQGGAGSADVQVSLDGVTWRTLAQVLPDEAWAEVQVDLSEYSGHRIFVQFAYRPLLGETAVWRVVNVRVIRRD